MEKLFVNFIAEISCTLSLIFAIIILLAKVYNKIIMRKYQYKDFYIKKEELKQKRFCRYIGRCILGLIIFIIIYITLGILIFIITIIMTIFALYLIAPRFYEVLSWLLANYYDYAVIVLILGICILIFLLMIKSLYININISRFIKNKR